MSGKRPQRLRRTAAVAVLACLLLTIPAAAWAGDVNGRPGDRSEPWAGEGRRGDADEKHDRRGDDRWQGPDRDGKAAGSRQERRPKPHAHAGRSHAPSKRDDEVVTAASADDDVRAETDRKDRDDRDADRARDRRDSKAGERHEAPKPAPTPEPEPEPEPEPTAAPDTTEGAGQPPVVEDEKAPVVAVVASPAPPAPQAGAPAAPAPAAAERTPLAVATPSADALAHERGVVDRTFRAGSALLRDTGRAVVDAMPPPTRTFGIPLGLLAALGGYMIAQRRFQSGPLPMSAAAVPMQEGARERHRL